MAKGGESKRVAAIVTSRYEGTCPSPAHVWSRWVIVTCGIGASLAAAACLLNLVERRYQQQRASSHPPSAAQIHRVVSAIHTFTNLGALCAAAFVVVCLIWSTKRRPRARLKRFGESAVEVALWRAAPAAYLAFWVTLSFAILATLSASATLHVGMSSAEFVRYRTWLAASAGARAMSWLSLIVVVAQATHLQSRREMHTIATLQPA